MSLQFRQHKSDKNRSSIRSVRRQNYIIARKIFCTLQVTVYSHDRRAEWFHLRICRGGGVVCSYGGGKRGRKKSFDLALPSAYARRHAKKRKSIPPSRLSVTGPDGCRRSVKRRNRVIGAGIRPDGFIRGPKISTNIHLFTLSYLDSKLHRLFRWSLRTKSALNASFYFSLYVFKPIFRWFTLGFS